MTVPTVDEAAAAPAALAAFLRGVERRGAVFAALATGSAEAGDAALATTMRAFRVLAADAPFIEWPRRFWSLLLAAPPLRRTVPRPDWPPQFAYLAGLGRGPRAALLLRLVAGLAEADGAAVLGVARPTYRLALLGALPHHADGRADAEAWRALAESAQAAIRSLPPERLAEIARQRDAAVRGLRVAAPPRATRRPRGGGGRAQSALWAVAAATGLALGATWWIDPDRQDVGSGAEDIRVEALPPSTPATKYPAELALVMHPDFELLLAPDEAAASDPGFYAWYAAQLEQARSGADAAPLIVLDAAEPPAENRPESSDAPR